MNCIEDIVCGKKVIIGVKDYINCTKPESGLFINQLPGITLKTAANVANEEFQGGLELMRQSTIMAAQQVKDEFISRLGPLFNFNSIVETRQLDQFTDKVLPAAPLERGIVVKRWRSELARTFIDSVYIRVQNAGSATLKIIEVVQEGQTYKECKVTNYQINLLADCVNTIKLDYLAQTEQVRIVFDQTSFDTNNCGYNQFGNTCNTCYGISKGITIQGWNGTKEDGNCYGVGVYVNVRCYEENVFCALLPRMYFLMWYKSGIVFLEDFIASTRINNFTIFGKEQAKELLKQYTEKYNEKYEVIIKNAYDFIKSTKGECLTCNGSKYVQSTP